MKKIGILLIVLAAFISFVSAGQAEIKDKAFSVTPFIGGFTFDGVQSLTTKPVYGIRAGYNLTPKWALEGVLNYVRTDPSGASDRVHVYNYRVEALYNFMAEKKLVPFLAAGIGGQNIDAPDGIIGDGSNAVVDYGAGIKYFLTENLALRADVRHILVFDDETLNNLEYALGLTYYWGGEKAKASPAPAKAEEIKEEKAQAKAEAAPVVVLDADKDGVPDGTDQCPNTPKGLKADKFGCPADTDADGVADYQDKCPNTPVDVNVDKKGCPLDTDADGVADYLDKCADTPKGVKVDKEGCSIEVVKKAPEAAVSVAKEMIEKGRATLNVEFDTNKAVVKSKYLDQINKIAEVMKQHPDIGVVIEGHTDSLGSDKANIQLSEKRANAVKAKLVEMGIDSARVKAIGYGPSKPVAANDTAVGRKLNRRVEAAVEYEIKK